MYNVAEKTAVSNLGKKNSQYGTCTRGLAYLKFNVRNCEDVVNAFMNNMEHLQIA